MSVCSNFQIVTFDYGKGNKNPMDEVWFYQKNAPDVPVKRAKEEASNDKAKTFYNLLIQLFFGWAGRGEYFSLTIFCRVLFQSV